MEYIKKAELKVECIASQEDFDFFGITVEDVLNKTDAGMLFLKKLKKLCGMVKEVEWTDVAYTLNITVLAENKISFEFSECIKDYIRNLRYSIDTLTNDETRGTVEGFINALEDAGEESGRKIIELFEKNIRREKSMG